MQGSEILLVVVIILAIFIIPGLSERPARRKLLRVLSDLTEQPQLGGLFNDYMLKGFYRTRAVQIMETTTAGGGPDDDVAIRMTPHAVPKPVHGFVNRMSGVALGNGFRLVKNGNDHFVTINQPWLPNLLGLFYPAGRITPEQVRFCLDALATACEQVENGAYTV